MGAGRTSRHDWLLVGHGDGDPQKGPCSPRTGQSLQILWASEQGQALVPRSQWAEGEACWGSADPPCPRLCLYLPPLPLPTTTLQAEQDTCLRVWVTGGGQHSRQVDRARLSWALRQPLLQAPPFPASPPPAPWLHTGRRRAESEAPPLSVPQFPQLQSAVWGCSTRWRLPVPMACRTAEKLSMASKPRAAALCQAVQALAWASLRRA